MPQPSGSARRLPRVRLQAHRRRDQILASALTIFSQKGFRGTSTRDLARRAGVSEALLFRHFATKEALVQAILDVIEPETRLRVAEEQCEHLPPREVLTSIAEQMLTNLKQHPDVIRVLFFGVLEAPHFAREVYQRFLARLLALETRLFERAFAAADAQLPAASIDAAIVARAFHGSLLFYSLAGAILQVEPVPDDPRARAKQIVGIYLPEVEP